MNNIAILTVILFLSGCTSNMYVADKKLSMTLPVEKTIVYVTNQDIGEPYDILVRSGIYKITNLSSNPNKLTLEPIEDGVMCGMPLFSSMFSLGIIPVRLPNIDTFRYVIETPGSKIKYSHRLNVYTRVSLWEWLFKPFSKSKVDVMSEALARSNMVSTFPVIE